MIIVVKPFRSVAGFTLVELAVSVAVIALLTAAILGGSVLIDSAKATDLVAKAKDLSAAAKTFRERHKYWPGDLPNAAAAISNLPAACDMGTGTAAIGDGLVNTATEVNCAIEELFQAGLIRADLQAAATFHTISLEAGLARIVGAGSSNVVNFPLGTNVIEFSNVRCALVQSMDRKIDDGNIAAGSTGRAKSSVAACTNGGANDPVPFYAVAIN